MDTNFKKQSESLPANESIADQKFSIRKVAWLSGISLIILLAVLIPSNRSGDRNNQDKLSKLNNILTKKEVIAQKESLEVNHNLHKIIKNQAISDNDKFASISKEKQQLRELLNRKEIENNKLTNSLKSLRLAKIRAEKMLKKEIAAKKHAEEKMQKLAGQEKFKKAYKQLAKKVQEEKLQNKLQEIAKSKVLSINDKQLLDAPDDNYCLQILGASNLSSIKQFVSKHSLGTKANYYKSKLNNKDWFVLVYGNYQSISDAKNVISNLPEEVQSLNPYVRSYKSVKKSMLK